jgi:hypothetical protein
MLASGNATGNPMVRSAGEILFSLRGRIAGSL